MSRERVGGTADGVVSMGACVPAFFLVMPETRTTIILRRRAAKLRKERGLADGGRYLAHAEMEKVKFMVAMKTSLVRPLIFLATEPIVMFFSLWVALAVSGAICRVACLGAQLMSVECHVRPGRWAAVHDEDAVRLQHGASWSDLPDYLVSGAEGFRAHRSIGAMFGFVGGHIQEYLYRRYAPSRGVEARLYTPMGAGIIFTAGCLITGFTARSEIHWIGSAIGQVIVISASSPRAS